jgi:flavin-dependent dehydrogenase
MMERRRTVEYHVDVAVVGASTGGTAAALAALQAGCSVLLTEETDWVGGQFIYPGIEKN